MCRFLSSRFTLSEMTNAGRAALLEALDEKNGSASGKKCRACLISGKGREELDHIQRVSLGRM